LGISLFTKTSGVGKGGWGINPPIGSEKKNFLEIFLHNVKIVKIKKHLMILMINK